mgnify:FL=1
MELLIDADSLLYKYAAVNQDTFDWGEGQTTLVADLELAKGDLDDFIYAMLDATGTTKYKMFVSSKENFRYDILPSYKQNRKGLEKPILLEPLREYLLAAHPAQTTTKIEADDACCILMDRYPGRYVLAHIDKDLNQAVGTHYNWNKDDTYEIDEHQARYFFYYQVLVGDQADGYKGCPGIGDKKATVILEGITDDTAFWEAIVETYVAKGFTEEDALVQARVAKMLDNNLWKDNEVILWEPTKSQTSV